VDHVKAARRVAEISSSCSTRVRAVDSSAPTLKSSRRNRAAARLGFFLFLACCIRDHKILATQLDRVLFSSKMVVAGDYGVRPAGTSPVEKTV
jgi:hypothetical protein